jgi:hypothetical protein
MDRKSVIQVGLQRIRKEELQNIMPTKEDKPRDTVAGYAGPSDTTTAGIPPGVNVDKPEGAVIGEGGTLTLPTVITIGGASYKKPSESDRIIGRALLEGDTFNGYHRKIIVELTSAVTQEGAFNVFRNHFGDAIFDGFKAKGIKKEDAEKLVEEWRKEGAIPGQAPVSEDEGKSKKG